ncbi:MAG: serine/threonine protein kinase [Myxococcales bacterium]|nr:serine/threonine protein kinase [Myxococcales bacterium]
MIVLQPGTVIADGLYTLRRQLGTGATAHVWAATQKLPNGELRDIVLKILLPEIRLDAKKREMFLEEARLAATLQHQAIVEVYSIDQTADFDFLVMERIWGTELDELIELVKKEKTKIPWHLAIAMIHEAAQGIHYANTLHDRNGTPLNLVHRDIKPGNLLLDIYGQIKVIDFGIAKTATSHLKTQTGIIKGTIAYMSPEHLRSEKLDVRSDIYALTVVLYELCTGYRPFAGENMTSVMFSILTQEPYEPQSLCAELPDDLSQFLLRNLSKNKEERSVNAATYVQELEALLRTHHKEVGKIALRDYLKKYKPELFDEYKEVHGKEPQAPQADEHAETQALLVAAPNEETQAITGMGEQTTRLPGAQSPLPTASLTPVIGNFDLTTLSDDVRDTIAQGEGAQLPDYVRELAQKILSGQQEPTPAGVSPASLPTADFDPLQTKAMESPTGLSIHKAVPQGDDLYQKTVTDEQMGLVFSFPNNQDFGATQPSPVKVHPGLYKENKEAQKTMEFRRKEKKAPPKRSLAWLWLFLLLLLFGLGLGVFLAIYMSPKPLANVGKEETCVPKEGAHFIVSAPTYCKIQDQEDTPSNDKNAHKEMTLVPANGYKKEIRACVSYLFRFRCGKNSSFARGYTIDNDSPKVIRCSLTTPKDAPSKGKQPTRKNGPAFDFHCVPPDKKPTNP